MSTTVLERFAAAYPFGLDDFQVRACDSILAGRGVLVAAPTGSGKTVVGEFAVHLAVERAAKCFYTTPIKALSNQKYNDLVARYGAEQVGLLTGDNSDQRRGTGGGDDHRGPAQHALRRIAARWPGCEFVVMDEVHYLADRERGPVWEEVIIYLPEHVAVVALSATVSNAEEFGAWLARGPRRHRHRGRGAPAGPALAARPRRRQRCTTCSSTRRAGRSTPSWSGWPATTSASTRRAASSGSTDIRPGADRRGLRAPARGGRRPRTLPGAQRPDIVRALQRGRPAALHQLHLQPGRMRGRGRAVPARGAVADHPRRAHRDPRAGPGAGRRPAARRTWRSWVSTAGSTAWSGGSPRTTPG